jgi:hypothetical protein
MCLWVITMVIVILCAVPSRTEAETKAKVPMGSVAHLDARYGFRDVHFGMTLEQLGFDISMECYQFDMAPRTCRRSYDKEDNTFGAAQLLSIDYVFSRDRLMAVDLWISGSGTHPYELSAEVKRNGKAALAVLQEAYGKGETDQQSRIVWKGKRASARYAEHENPRTPIFEDGPRAASIKITIWSNELAAQFKSDQQTWVKLKKQREQEEIKKAAGKL